MDIYMPLAGGQRKLLKGYFVCLSTYRNLLPLVSINSRFCFNENVWHFIAPLVPQRRCFSATVYNNRLYVIGGNFGEANPTSNRVDYFDPSKNKWIAGTPMAFNRLRPTLSEAKGFLYVYSSKYLERYDPVANSWMVRKDF